MHTLFKNFKYYAKRSVASFMLLLFLVPSIMLTTSSAATAAIGQKIDPKTIIELKYEQKHDEVVKGKTRTITEHLTKTVNYGIGLDATNLLLKYYIDNNMSDASEGQKIVSADSSLARFKSSLKSNILNSYGGLVRNSNFGGFMNQFTLDQIFIVTKDNLNKSGRCSDTNACYFFDGQNGMVLYLNASYFRDAIEPGGASAQEAREVLAHELIHVSTAKGPTPNGPLQEGIVEYLACQATSCSAGLPLSYPDEYLVVKELVEKAGISSSDLYLAIRTTGYDSINQKLAAKKINTTMEDLDSILGGHSVDSTDRALALIDGKNNNAGGTNGLPGSFGPPSPFCSGVPAGGDLSTFVKLINNSTKIKKGDKINLLMQNLHEYSIKYDAKLFKIVNGNDEPVTDFTNYGNILAVGGLNNPNNLEIETGNLALADYALQVVLTKQPDQETGTDKVCSLRAQEFKITITDYEDQSGGDGQLKSGKDIQIVLLNNGKRVVKPKEAIGFTIKNNTNVDYTYTVKVDNIETGEFITKISNSPLKAKVPVNDQFSIDTKGKHVVEIDILGGAGETTFKPVFEASSGSTVPSLTSITPSSTANLSKTLYLSKRFYVIVDEHPEDIADPGDYPEYDKSKPTTNSDNAELDVTLGGILKAALGTETDMTKLDLGSLERVILKIIDYALNFAGIAAFVMVLWGIRMFFSYGSEEAVAMAKKTMTWSLIGLIVIMVSKGILNWIVYWFTLT